MKFRTEIAVAPLRRPIGYGERILTLGSCFADALRERLEEAKFRVGGNFAGPLFNPASIADALERAAAGTPYTLGELGRSADGNRFSFDTATRFDDPDADVVLARCNEALGRLREALSAADRLVITFGTAWVYRLADTGAVVANCHREPAARFRRERLAVAEIADRWSELLEGLLAGRQVILTVSPVRHLGDGLEGNAVSKAVLRLAADELAARHPDRVHYFPAYEILTDDLRDYRFYADDLVHPSPRAVEYVWERFAEAAFDATTRERIETVRRLTAFCRHTPRHAGSEADRRACSERLAELERLQQAWKIDFSYEIARLKARISR